MSQTPTVPIPAALLQGGGEMGALIRSFDWERTALGPSAEWPSSLRTTVGTVLGSRFPMLLWWGPDLIQLYNDAYRPVLGDKHPRSLGAPGAQVWAEIWHIIGPMAEGILAGGPATWSEHLLLPMSRKGIEREETYFTFSYSPVPSDSGALGGVLVTCQETTAQVLGERRLRTLQKIMVDSAGASDRLDAARRATRALAENANDLPFAILYLVGKDGPFAAASAGLAEGQLPPAEAWPLAQVSATRAAAYVPVPPALRAALGDAQDSSAPVAVLPIQLRGDDGVSGFLVLCTSARLELEENYKTFLGLVAGHVSSAIAQADAYAQERRRAEALAEIDKAKTTFFSNVSHEFRTPLTLMLGPLEESLKDTEEPLTRRQRERQETLHRNSVRLLRLVNALLDFSRIEAGRVRATYQPTDLGALTADVASNFRSLVEKAGLAFEVKCAPLPGPVYVDREMWERIVLNLVSNAFKFTFEGGIRVTVSSDGDRAVLEVADTGTGIPSAEVPHLFERFHRVQEARGRTYEGSGIGLAMVRELARLHGGSVAVETTEGVGSRFSVAIPFGAAHLPQDRLGEPTRPTAGASVAAFLAEASLWTADEPEALGPPEPQAVPGIGGDVVLAEDNADMRAYLRRVLEEEGWTVRAFVDGEAALEAIRARVPDLVLTDVMMPRMDGFALLRALRAAAHTRSLPVLILSARAGEEARLDGLEAGADDYLVKPFTARELVARVRIHLELARSRKEAERHRQSLQELFMEAPALIAILRGPEHVFELANPLYLRAVGRDVIGRPVREALPELQGQPFFHLLDEVYRTGTTRTGTEFEAFLDRDGDGKPEACFFDFAYRPMRDASGEVDGILVFAFDVTAQVQARRRVESLMSELEIASERKDEFLAMLAHELRNPMAAISMALSLMERAGNDEARLRKHRATARRQMDVLTRLVDDLLDVSRITRGKVDLQKEPLDLANVVQNAVAATRAVIQAQNHELTVTVAHGIFRMVADGTRLEQVVTNLLTNAAKYTPPGGRITVRLARDPRPGRPWAELRVTDTGRGIPKEMLTQVFDLFVQVAPTLDRRSGGLGLGLTLVKRLTEMHGGTVEVRSDGPGRGSEFIVRVPLASRAELEAAGAADVDEVASPPAERRRIVIVEDSHDVRDALREFLEELGHDVEVAGDGPAGVARVLEVLPDVALVDVGLPGIDGYEVARRVRAAAGGDGVYLVALTGYGGAEASARATRAGFDLHITKPVDIDALPRVVSLTRQVH